MFLSVAKKETISSEKIKTFEVDSEVILHVTHISISPLPSLHTSARIECDCEVRSLAIVLLGDLDCVRFDGPKAVQGGFHHSC